MAQILGNLSPQDDYTHELGPEPNFNESMYFNFFDRQESIGGFVRIGNRANEGHAEMTVTLYLPDGRVLLSDHHRIRVLSADLQQVRTVAGDGEEGHRDGAAAQAQFGLGLGW